MNDQISFIRKISCGVLVVFMLLINTTLSAQDSYDYSSLVIVKVTEMTNDQYNQLSNTIALDAQYSFEYACVQSGIVVLRYYHNFAKKGDVSMAVKSKLRQRGQLGGLEIIFVDVSWESTAKC